MSQDVNEDFADAVERAVAAVVREAPTSFSGPSSTAPRLVGETFYFASIGFVGAIRGTMVVVAAAPVIAALSSADVSAQLTTDAFTQDVVGELANLTLGRLKSVLLAHGVSIMLALPTTGSGSSLRFTNMGPLRSMWLGFESVAGSVYFRVDADLSDCPPFGEIETAGATMTEGELVLF